MKTKGVFKSLAGIGSVVSIVMGLIGWFNGLPPELIDDSRTFLIMVVTGVLTLYGRWKAAVPLSLRKPFEGHIEFIPKGKVKS